MSENKEKLIVGTVSAPAPTEILLEKGADPVIASTEEQMETFLEKEQTELENTPSNSGLPAAQVSHASSMTVSSSATVMDFQDLMSFDKSLVLVKASAKAKFMEPGKTYPVSKEQAAQLEKEGQATIVK